MPQEIERRWILPSPHLEQLPSSILIEQAYPDPYRDPCVRVRMINGQRAELTTKSGNGLVRGETTRRINVGAARELQRTTPFRLRKRRFVIDGCWELDIYENELSGLVILERELSAEDMTTPELPAWAGPATEVTQTLDNRRLAILAAYGFDAATIVEDRVPKRVVLTGAPLAGKSTVLQVLASQFPHQLHVIPEVATIAFGHLGVAAPTTEEHARRYNRHACSMQRTFEDMGRLHAHRTGRRLVILDRGLIDNVAYCPNILELIGSSREREYSEYQAVLHLAVPDEATYYAHKAQNSTRLESETHEVALDLEQRIREAWSDHPHYHFVSNEGGWRTKVERTLNHVRNLLTT